MLVHGMRHNPEPMGECGLPPPPLNPPPRLFSFFPDISPARDSGEAVAVRCDCSGVDRRALGTSK